MRLKNLLGPLLLFVCSVSAFAVTSVELDNRQQDVNRLNNRSIEVLNQHGLLKQIRDVRFFGEDTGIVQKSLEYYALSNQLLDKVKAFTVILDYSDSEIYSRREQIEKALNEISVLFWELTNQQKLILAQIDDAKGLLASVRSYPDTYLGDTYQSQMSAFEAHRLDVNAALSGFEDKIISQHDLNEVGLLLNEVSLAFDAVFQREAMRLPALANQFKLLKKTVEAWRQAKPELEEIRALKNLVLNAEGQGYRFLAIARLEALNSAVETSTRWLAATDFPDDIKASVQAEILDLKNSANSYLATARNSTPDEASVLNLLLKMKNELSTACAKYQSIREKYDCQIVRQYQGVDTNAFVNIYQQHAGFLPIIEKQIRAAYAGPEGYLND